MTLAVYCHFSTQFSLFLFSIAMATKENMTSQRGMLKSIQSRVNTLASILCAARVHGCVCVCVCVWGGRPKRKPTIDWKLKDLWYEITAGPSEINAHILLFSDGKWVFVIKIYRDVLRSSGVSQPNDPFVFCK